MKMSFACAALAIVIVIVFPVVAYPLVSQAGPTPAPRNGGKMIAAMMMSVLLVSVPAFLNCLVLAMTLSARRTAGMLEIRSSLAAIDAQLRAVGAHAEPLPKSSAG